MFTRGTATRETRPTRTRGTTMRAARENVSRKIVVSANVAGRDVIGAVTELQGHIAGELDLAMGIGEPGKEIQAPLAVVVLGGLLTSTLLNMVVVPALFMRWGNIPVGEGAQPGRS